MFDYTEAMPQSPSVVPQVLLAEAEPLKPLLRDGRIAPGHYAVFGPRELPSRFLTALAYPTECAWVEKRELFLNETLRVLQVRVPVLERDRLVKRLAAMEVPLYDADMHLVQAYHYERGHFPLALCRFEIEEGILKRFDLDDDPWAVDYEGPELRTMNISLTGSEVVGRLDPNHAARGRITLTMEKRSYELEGPIAEYDFTSMYPKMMVQRNVSPETVNCLAME